MADVINNMGANGFVKKRVGSLTLGEKLRKLRSDGRMSLADVSRATKIQVKYLECLESGNYGQLPADVYVRGFLRSYAVYLGVSDQALIKLYEREKGIQRNIHGEQKQDELPTLSGPRFTITSQMLVIIGAILLFFGGVFYLYREINSFVATPVLVVAAPADGASINGKVAVVEGTAASDARVFINTQPVLVGETGEFREEVTLQPGINIITVRARNKFDKETVQMITIQAVYPTEDSVLSPETEEPLAPEEQSPPAEEINQ